MNVLYLTEDYIGSRVHHNLCNAISVADNQIDITLFNVQRPNYPLHDLRSSYTNQLYTPVSPELHCNMLMYRMLFPYKVNRKYNLLTQSVNLNNINITIASTLFSDGAVALRLWHRFRIPYVVAVRGTDVNLYLRYMPHLYHIGRQIIKNASKVVFLNGRMQRIVSNSAVGRGLISESNSKVIANGIDDIWIDNQCFDDSVRIPNSVLYIGIFDRNKNVSTLISACAMLRRTIPDLTLNLVGGNGDCYSEVVRMVGANNNWIKYHGQVYDKQKLMHICRSNSAFAMISKSETFGLVYIEALSQGLPVIFTDNQGFSGVLPNLNVGTAVDPSSTADVAAGIAKVLNSRTEMLADVKRVPFDHFRWKNIAAEWLKLLAE